ncbi:von Willebrand factor A domain-containing protein 3B isoform X2 [Dasypus novemcinctus]|uniref:von Willebrand factor A domain-containing protein 3B isoform X2 n=1 Tax=Dasypus novemcinctus TaxID=9361 RepID=UPI00265FD31D|nr:von Willebrand factor A domain-containing protein 3B isoform X2 [Dasypus novemcinctus]
MSCDLDLNPAMEKLGSFPTAPEQQPQEPEGAGGRRDSAVQSLVSSEQWLRLHGLKSRRLTLKQILSQIGFPHQEDYVTSLGRFVASRYADGLFPQCGRAEDGSVYHLTAKSDLILQFAERLARAAESYRQRMDWLTSGSRQVFGVLLEQCVAVVLDWGDAREEERPLCRAALTMVLQEQVARVAKFNLVAVSQEPVKWQESAAPVTEQSIAAAVKWVEQLPLEQDVSPASRLAALLAAGADTAVECIYYFVVGDVPDDSKELLLQKAAESPCPVCTVSFNARGDGATAFLKDLSARTHGRFHAFAQRTECVDFPAPPLKEGGGAVTWNSRKLKGTLPPGAGVREDVFLIWKEMEEACSTLAHIQKLVAEPPEADGASARCESEATTAQKEPAPEATWGSREWLQRHGLKAQKLSFYDVLADCAFRHADGVVDIKAKPEDEAVQTSAETNKKTIHAKYCSRFVHAPWKDGSLVHVGITKEKCRRYHERMHTALAQIDKRLKWLQAGSQILFGKVPKDCVYVLIDTSHSMKGILDLVKDKIIQFIQEQLRYKSKFNFVKFDAQAVAWQEKLAEIDEDSLQRAKSWVRDIETGSSTNTLQALQMAFADEETEVIYLLTDGRPDQPPEMVLDQVKVFQKIPIYTISFNYNDEIANGFLKELSCLTGGEFHSYKFGCKDSCPPENLQNEDVTLLVKEMEQGRSDLEKVQSLYSESLIMDWWYNGEKEGDSKHQKEICSLISTPESVKPPSVDESVRTSPPNPTASRWVLPSQKIQKKKVLHAEPTRTSLLRSQLSALRSSARSEGKGSPSSRSSSNPVPSDTEMSIFLTEACSDDKSLEASTQEGRQVDDRDSLATSSATWLKTHGLAARKLTIMDILSVTAVPHSSTYVPVLDKHVTSKVFDEVFPLAHVSSDTNKMTLINPHGVKLNVYKQKVEQAIKSYEKRLNKIVWRALSQEEKEKLEASKPMRYLENKAALNEALERLHWPISLKELSLLEKEILAGKLYVQQARELQEAAKKEVQQKLQVNPTKKVKSKKPDPLRGQKVIARCDENGFYFPGVVKKCLSPTHALVGFRYGDTKVVPTSFITPVGGAMPCPLLQVGDYVFAKIVIPEGFDFYVPAIVIALPSQDDEADKFYTVLKCNNRREFCPRSALIKISQNKYALSCSHIKSPPVQEDPKMQEPDAAGSPVLTRPPRDADAGAGRELRQGTPRKKQRSRRLPPQEQGFSDSDSSSLSTRSQESCPQRHPQPKAGAGRRRTSPEEPEVAVKSSARETTPQFPGQFRSQYGRTSNTSQ